jgi:acetylornithine deacetylase/succinyl-diaminopimelate desuccinylase-like protein
MIDCRLLPGTTPDDMREEVVARLGDLAPQCTVEHVIGRAPVENERGELYDLLAATLRAHDPDAVPVPVMTPFATDAKTTALVLGVPTYGFTPLRLEPGEPFLARYHGVDERVGLEALRFGLPVLYDVVATWCG